MSHKVFKPNNLKMIPSDTEKDWKATIREEISHFKEVQSKISKKNKSNIEYDLIPQSSKRF